MISFCLAGIDVLVIHGNYMLVYKVSSLKQRVIGIWPLTLETNYMET